MKIHSLLSIPLLLLSIGTVAQAQEAYSKGEDYYGHSDSRRLQLVKYYKPTQTYYGKGYVVRYGYSTTTPRAAGYIPTSASYNASLAQYLTVTNSENRRDIAITRKTVTLPAKTDQQAKREIETSAPAATAPAPAPAAAPKAAAPQP